MAKVKYSKKEVATRQLITAVYLLINDKDLSSVITLAGAASNILEQLVRNEAKETFVDYARRVCNYHNKNTPARKKYKHYIDNILGINAHKHMSDSCFETIDLDLEQCAFDAVTKAIADYTRLYGNHEKFVKDFLSWAWKKQGQPEISELIKDIPTNFLKKNE